MNFKSDKELEKMKKVELIDHIKQLYQESKDKSEKIVNLINECSAAEMVIEDLKEELKVKNGYRGGRKEKFNKEQVELIKQARKENKSIRTIAKEFDCSIGLVHKITKDIEMD